jgi:methylmalonyl-CoA/ethylmalonyl-CoA epimerase
MKGNKIMPEILKINHVAILVEDIESALSFWRDDLGLLLDREENNPVENVRVAFLPVGNSELELVMPSHEHSGLARQLEKRGPGIHHVCLEVDDILGMMTILKAKGIQLINQEPQISTDGKKYAFVHPKSTQGVLVELYELPIN